MKRKSKFLLLLIFILFISSCTNKVERNMRLGMVQWLGYAPFYIAEKNNLFPKSLQIIDFPSNQDIVESFKIGEIDAAFLTLDEVVRLKKEGANFKIVLLIDSSYGADAILAKKDIKSIKELKSKRIAYDPSGVQEYLLYRALDKNNLLLEDIIPIYMKYDEQLTFDTNSYDAIVTFEPYKHKLLKKDMQTLFTSKEIKNEIIDLMIVSDEMIEKNSIVIQKIIYSYFKSLDFLQKKQKKEKMIEIVATYLNSNVEDIESSLKDINFLNKLDNLELLKENKISEKTKYINEYINRGIKNKNSVELSKNIEIKFIKRK